VWLTIAAVAASHVFMMNTPWGLRLRSVGEHPLAAQTQGVGVRGMRYFGVCLSGALAGAGGAWLAFHAAGFTAGMSNGRGYIALAALIFGKWKPLNAAAACLLFGLAEAVQIHLQSMEIGIPSQLVQALPFVLTMLALAGAVGRSRAPSALGKPF
jgi:simple sugar transport system permease protein